MLSSSQANRKVIAIYREPFKLGSPHVETWDYGMNVDQIVDRMKCLPKDFRTNGGSVRVNGKEVDAVRWQFTKPKANSIEKPVAVTFHMPVEGGSRGGGKQIFAIVAALALTVLTAGLATAPSLVAIAGTLGAKAIAAGVSLVGSLVINALTSTPVKAAEAANNDASTVEAAAVNGNLLEPNSPIPHVIGTRPIFPPFLSEPIYELIGQDEYIDALMGLAGAHALGEMRLGQSAVDPTAEDTDLTIATFDGLPGSEPIVYPQRYGRTFSMNLEMSTHGANPDDLSLFAPPAPVWHGMSTADDPHEAWMHLLSLGLYHGDVADYVGIAFRIRMRLRGDPTWRYLPEVHYRDKTQSQRRLQFKFRFHIVGDTLPITAPPTRGFVMARKTVPAQNVLPLGTIWNADSYFSTGAGDDVYNAGTESTTNIQNITLEAETVTFWFQDADWTPGIYDIEIIRGAAYDDNDFNASNYEYGGSGAILDFFGTQDGGNLVLTHKELLDRMTITRIVSVKNNPPIDEKNLTLIYMRVRNRTVGNFSVIASGYTKDWDGTGWNTLTTTSNPAPHYKDILSGVLNFKPLPEDMRDDASLVEWRQSCIDNDHTCDLICESSPVSELLRIVASCGVASPFQSELHGVIRDYDRSAEEPIQVFSSRNINGFKWRKAFPPLPAGLRANFKDDAYQYTGKQITVYRAGASHTDLTTEQVSYEGLTRRVKVIERANLDLKQSQYRSTIYNWNSPIEWIVCRRGSLIAINHDTVQQHYGGGRIDGVDVNNDDEVTGIVLDNKIEVKNTDYFPDVPNALLIENFLEVGLKTSIGIRRTNGQTSVHKLSNETSETDHLIFETPVADLDGVRSPFDSEMPKQIDLGCLVVVGIHGKEYKRLIVSDVKPGKDQTASITALDEAPEIWSN